MASSGTPGAVRGPSTSTPERLRKPSVAGAVEDGDYCRICRGEASDEQPLFYPCKCSGSIKYVHQNCLLEWLSHSQKKHCELCKTPFRFTKLYDRSMPDTLPFPLFLHQLVRHGIKTLARWARYLIVGFIWTCCLPWCIRQIWRGLFWLADGSWLSETAMRPPGLPDVPTSSTAASNPSTALASSSPALPNLTIPEAFDRVKIVVPPMLLSLSDIFRFLSGSNLLAKTLRILFSVPIPRVSSTGALNHLNTTSDTSTMHRKSSLLSGVEFATSWTAYPVVNNALLDVIEGQLICILLIAAFILVFLIREWVINQQHILNMPDPDLADNVAAPAPGNNDGRPLARPRRRVLRRPVEPVGPDGDPHLAIGQRPIAVPRPRRALIEDNIAPPANDGIEWPALPHHSPNLGAVPTDVPADAGAADAADEDAAEADISQPGTEEAIGVESEYHPEFPPLTTGVPEQGVDVPSNLEEASVPDMGRQESSSPVDQDFEPFHFEADQSSSPAFTQIAADDEISGITDRPRSPDFQLADPSDTNGDRHSGDQTSDSFSDSDGAIFPTPDADESGPESGEATSEDDDLTEAPEEAQREDMEAARSHSYLEQITAWLWPTEPNGDDDDALGRAADQDGVQLVDDPEAEAPFVPIHARDAVNGPPHLGGHQPRLVEQNGQFGIDLDDPNAIDDAEDLDGILELLGMEGPLSGIIQNVIFSLFLITVTLSASIWCPYIWGKIALLLLSNPVAVFIKAPLLTLSQSADVLVDLIFFAAGLLGFLLHHIAKAVTALMAPHLPGFSGLLDTSFMEELSLNVSQSSGARLEKALTDTFFGLRPDLPTFSMQSHHALKVFKSFAHNISASAATTILKLHDGYFTDTANSRLVLLSLTRWIHELPNLATSLFSHLLDSLHSLPMDPKRLSFPSPAEVDYSLVEWSTEDRIIAIVLGYAFFATAGFLFLTISHWILGLKEDEKVEGYLADSLRQAGGVMKVIVIIGIEMIVFPLYCGFLLDLALLPMFEGATVTGRIAFMTEAPFTGFFIHWFLGTCYMFHFALFVSMCRKIMRTGVLYFIRDPDDPTFHPVRDVLERPVPNQLGKIAFSALVYGGLVMVCLGGVIWTLSRVNRILPIQWAVAEPRLSFPVDVLFYNFMLPFILRKADLSKKIATLYEWWFRGCARNLRLTHFLFGEEREEEKSTRRYRDLLRFGARPKDGDEDGLRPDGTYVRAPASDSVRIPKGHKVFVEVNENNERVDGQPDRDKGLHGKTDDRFMKIYIPSQFKARITAFIFFLWAFAASTGVLFTIGPLLLGRWAIYLMARSSRPPNDLYAFTIGVHICAGVVYGVAHLARGLSYLKGKIPFWLGHTRELMPQILARMKYALGLWYLTTYVAIILPFTISFLAELYIYIPIYTHLIASQGTSVPTTTISSQPAPAIFVFQTWTLGLVYLRLLIGFVLNYPHPDTRIAMAIRGIVRNGVLHPDVRLASRAFVLPTAALCVFFLTVPLGYGRAVITLLDITDPETQKTVYRFAYPAMLGICLTAFATVSLKREVTKWRARIRDDVYLIGERLHNFDDVKPRRVSRKGKAKVE